LVSRGLRKICQFRKRSHADPGAAARKVEIAAATPAVQDGRIYIERINVAFVAPFPKGGRGHPEFGDGLRHAIEHGWLWMHESGTYLKLMPPGQDLLGK
jgi:hypothetical protein